MKEKRRLHTVTSPISSAVSREWHWHWHWHCPRGVGGGWRPCDHHHAHTYEMEAVKRLLGEVTAAKIFAGVEGKQVAKELPVSKSGNVFFFSVFILLFIFPFSWCLWVPDFPEQDYFFWGAGGWNGGFWTTTYSKSGFLMGGVYLDFHIL